MPVAGPVSEKVSSRLKNNQNQTVNSCVSCRKIAENDYICNGSIYDISSNYLVFTL